MPRNPLFNSPQIDAQSNGLTHDPAAVNPYKDWKQRTNHFDNSYRHATTERYADISPFMAIDAIPRDEIPFSVQVDTNTYTLSTPTVPDVFQHRFYSIVPYKAIIPNAWKLFYVNPTHGDDVPDDVYCNVDIVAAWWNMYNNVRDFTLSQAIEFIISTESIFSTGSLFSKFKANLWPYLYQDRQTNFDTWFDTVFAPWVNNYIYVERSVGQNLFDRIICKSDTNVSGVRVVKLRTLLDVLRSGNYRSILPIDGVNITSSLQAMLTSFISLVDSAISKHIIVDIPRSYPIDLSRLIAYQITCVSQYTDSSIDYLFNADLFRNNFATSYDTFEYNDMIYRYDVFSRHMFESVHFSDIDNFNSTCQYLFTYQQSLKFGDYFTTSRPKPLANGDVDIDPNGDGSINALETARRLVYVRYLNWSNRVGPKYEDYVKAQTGLDAFPEDTDAAPINHKQNLISSYNVENTGSAQLNSLESVTSLIKASDRGSEFSIFVTQPSIVLGLSSYDCERLYTRIMDRANLKDSRFDFFNERLQYTGDQPIYACELNATRSPDDPIAYTTKDMHYKKQVSHASGGFIFYLPSWSFSTEESDMDDSLTFGINPYFIRNINSDFDRFYKQLTGYSLGTYFHFAQRYNNILPLTRAMDVAPDIL